MNTTVITEAKIIKNTLISDLKQLTKMGLSLSVVFSSVAGYFLAVDVVHYPTVFLLALGGYFMVGASNAFNQVVEKEPDALMKRTKKQAFANRKNEYKFCDDNCYFIDCFWNCYII